MTDKKKTSSPKSSKKDARHEVEQKLIKLLAHLKPQLGEKKFKRRMKEAGKLIMHGIDVSKAKKAAPAVKKAAAKAPGKQVQKASKKKSTKK